MLGRGALTSLFNIFKEVYPVEHWKKEGFFLDSALLDIDCHWMTFEPARSFTYFLMAVVYAVVFLWGFLSNIFSIYIIVRYYYTFSINVSIYILYRIG